MSDRYINWDEAYAYPTEQDLINWNEAADCANDYDPPEEPEEDPRADDDAMHLRWCER